MVDYVNSVILWCQFTYLCVSLEFTMSGILHKDTPIKIPIDPVRPKPGASRSHVLCFTTEPCRTLEVLADENKSKTSLMERVENIIGKKTKCW